MLIYNVTTQIENSLHDKWLDYMLQLHIPDVMKSNCFQSYRMCRLDSAEETNATTYVFQYLCSSQEVLDNYIQLHAPALRQDVVNRFGDKFVAFRSIMEVISEG